jgi:tetratricopeptide (TPR) repeat protein
LGEIYYYANDPIRSLYAILCTVNLSESAGTSPELARSLAMMGAVVANIPLPGLGRLYCSRAIEVARQCENPQTMARTAVTAGVFYVGAGQLREAHDLFQEAARISEDLGDHRRWYDAMVNWTATTYLRGEAREALALANRLLETATRWRDSRYRSAALREKLFCLAALGEEDASRLCLEELENLEADIAPLDQGMARLDHHTFSALLDLRGGRPQGALEHITRAAEISSEISTSHTYYTSLFAFAGGAEVHLALWEALEAGTIQLHGTDGQPLRPHDLQPAAHRACRVLWSYARVRQIARPLARLHRGSYHWLEGKKAQAQRDWQESATEAEALGLPGYQALAEYSTGRHLSPTDPRRKPHLEHAAEIFAEMGAVYHLKRTRELLTP